MGGYWFNRIPPPARQALCRVSGCTEPVAFYSSGFVALHGFCWKHVSAAPDAYLRRWCNAKSLGDLRRVWDEMADEFEFERQGVA